MASNVGLYYPVKYRKQFGCLTVTSESFVFKSDDEETQGEWVWDMVETIVANKIKDASTSPKLLIKFSVDGEQSIMFTFKSRKKMEKAKEDMRQRLSHAKAVAPPLPAPATPRKNRNVRASVRAEDWAEESLSLENITPVAPPVDEVGNADARPTTIPSMFLPPQQEGRGLEATAVVSSPQGYGVPHPPPTQGYVVPPPPINQGYVVPDTPVVPPPPVPQGYGVVPSPPVHQGSVASVPPAQSAVVPTRPQITPSTTPDKKDDGGKKCSWSGFKKWFRATLDQTFREHVLFNLFFWKSVKDDKAYTPFERIANFIGFLGAEGAVVALFSMMDMADRAVCACIHDKDKYEETNCHVVGADEYTLPSDGLLRKEWLQWLNGEEYINYITRELDCSNEYGEYGEPYAIDECSLEKACCTAYIGEVLGDEKTFSSTWTCPQHWILQAFYESMVATLTAAFLLVPLVEWLLRKESQKLNPIAYGIILLQVVLGIVMPLQFAEESEKLGMGGYGWAKVGASVLMGVFFHSIYLGFLWEAVIVPLYEKYSGKKKREENTTNQATYETAKDLQPTQTFTDSTTVAASYTHGSPSSHSDAAYVFGSSQPTYVEGQTLQA